MWPSAESLEKPELIGKSGRALIVDRAGSAVLEGLICSSIHDPRYLAQIPVACLIVVASWFIWWERRQCTKGEKIPKPERSIFSIQALALNFCRACIVHFSAKEVMWAKPLQGTLKLNIDASFDYERNTASMGAILRDDAGLFIAAEICYIWGPSSYLRFPL